MTIASSATRLAVLFALLAAVSAVRDGVLVRPTELAASKSIIEAVNSNESLPWTAGENDMFKALPMEEAKKLLGAFM